MTQYYSPYKNDFLLMQNIHREFALNKPYLVGGAVRNYLLGISPDAIADLDITTLSSDCVRLGILFAQRKNKVFKMFKDHHITIVDDLKNIDFSSNVGYKSVYNWMKKNKKDIKYLESYSRDFTINSMHQDFFSGEVFDPTGMGKSDIKNGIIRTPCPAKITLENDKRRVFRAINLAIRFGLEIDNDIIEYSIKEYSKLDNDESFARVSEINEAIVIDPDKTFNFILKMGLYKKIPLVGPYKDFLIRKNLIIDYMS